MPLPPLFACIAVAMLAVHSTNAFAQERTRLIAARDLVTLHDIAGLNLSPDGRWVAFSNTQADTDRNTYDIAWHTFEIATGRVGRVGGGGEMLPSNDHSRTIEYYAPHTSAWSPDSRWIAYLRRDNGHTQIWRARRDGREGEQLSHGQADVRALRYTRDGSRILFETEPSQTQLEQSLAEEGQSGFLYDDRFLPLSSARPTFPRDTANLYDKDTHSQIEARRIWAYDIVSRRGRLATEAERTEYATLTAQVRRTPRASVAVAAPRGTLAWTEPRDPERQGWAPPTTILAQPLGGSAPIVCEAPACTNSYISRLWWRNDEELVFERREGQRQQDRALYAWRPSDGQAPRLIVRTPNTLSDCAVAKDKLLCLSEEPNYPGRVVTIDLDRGAIETLHDPNPDFGRFDLGPAPQRLAIPSASGIETYGYLILPPHAHEHGRLPLVVVTYRCLGFLRGGVGDEYPIYPFAARGFAVLCFDSPRDQERMARLDLTAFDNWARGPGVPASEQIEDALEAALTQLDRAGIIDPDRVGVTGLSYGAEIVAFALPRLPRLAAAIASSGGPGPGIYPYLGPRLRARYRDWGLIAPQDAPERWREYSFTSKVHAVFAPLLLNVADHEFLQNLDAVTALQDAGRGVEMYVFPDEYHVKWQPAHRLAIYNRNIDWMNFWLQGREDPAPAKAEQYKRWRAMRVKQCELFRGDNAPWYCRP